MAEKTVAHDHQALVIIVQSAWLRPYANRVAFRCKSELELLGVKILHFEVPGVLTMAYTIRKLSRKYAACSAFVAISVIQRGETRHADYIVQSSLDALCKVMMTIDKPIVCEFLVGDSTEQIEARSGEDENNRGFHAACDVGMLMQLEKLLGS